MTTEPQDVKLDSHTLSEIARVREHAENNPIPEYTLRQMARGEVDAVGESSNHVLDSELGFRVVYSLEEQPFGLSKHISVSVGKNMIPSPKLVQYLMECFGFTSNILSKDKDAYTLGNGQQTMLNIWHERSPYGPAINVVERIEDEEPEKHGSD